jgi:hypothetical protein
MYQRRQRTSGFDAIERMRYSAEFLRAQSQRMDELVRQEEERLRKERKKGSKAGR